jgi:DNA mismatch repair ATPase MutS
MGSLVLLDEILRGTNSEDKSHGSEVLLEKLITKNAVTILATHDLKLSLLGSRYPEQVQNYCFESEIVNNELFFDYKIKKGVAQNKNATFLMKKMGIV